MPSHENVSLNGASIADRISAPEIDTVAMTPKVPPEICAIIIDLLKYDKSSLKSMSLTCYAWSDRARRHLFRELSMCSGHITTSDYEAPFEGWKNKMLKTLPFATLSFVRNVYLSGINEYDVIRAAHVLEVIQALPHMETLAIFKLDIDDLRVCQTARPMPTVTVLTIASPLIPRRQQSLTPILYFISLFLGLEILTLSGIGAELGQNPLPRAMLPQRQSIPRLQHLRLLENCMPILPLIEAIQYLSSPDTLRILTLDSVRDSILPSTGASMYHIGPYLHELKIETTATEAVSDLSYQIPGLDLCTNLRILHLSVHKTKDWFSYLRRNLAAVFSNCLEKIEMDIPFAGEDIREITNKDWKSLIPMLSNFPALKVVVVNVILTADTYWQKVITRGLQLGLGCCRDYVLQVVFCDYCQEVPAH